MPVCSGLLTENALESIRLRVSTSSENWLFDCIQGQHYARMKEHQEGRETVPQDAPGLIKQPRGPVKHAQREIPAPNDSYEMAACAIRDPPACWQET